MRFFKRNSDDDEAAFRALLMQKDKDSKKKSLQSWWQEVRDKNGLSFLSGHQTRQLDASIAALSEIIDNFELQNAKARYEALQKLSLQVQNWQYMHAIMRRDSSRSSQVKVLGEWLKEQKAETEKFLKENQQLPEISKENVSSKSNPYAGVEISDQQLYRWWKEMSNLGWHSMRSAATKELDSAIQWYSQSVILDRIGALEALMVSIEVWREERKDVSSRLPMVEALQQHIGERIAQLQQDQANEAEWDQELGNDGTDFFPSP
ncbi:hypothetical protein [Legionella brunensis]|uniref:Uncharacterized protein n=1 Tax=Legionella brunensis TaxID=29422 RepID=A0A0W0SU47_9GAMM|nr:hypothetical protein [Legionella brunensis]KTC86882.1 hypothetical protein Lbru_0111 [Legionella brunensis]